MSEFRPKTLDELVGHSKVKKKAAVAAAAALHREEPLPHCLLSSAGGGLGKTTLAQVLANETYAPFVSSSATAVQTPIDLRNLILRLKPRTVLLIDEFHAIGKAARDELLLVLEQGVIHVSVGKRGPIRLQLPPFTLVAATTEPEALPAPLAQRFRLQFHLNPLFSDEMQEVVARLWQHWGISVDESVRDDLACRARGIPRRALGLSERVRDVVQARGASVADADCMAIAMAMEGVDEIGLIEEERQILLILRTSEPDPVSARNLALALGVQRETITQVYEPALMRMGLMTVGPGGRRLTEQGREHLAARQPEANPLG